MPISLTPIFVDDFSYTTADIEDYTFGSTPFGSLVYKDMFTGGPTLTTGGALTRPPPNFTNCAVGLKFGVWTGAVFSVPSGVDYRITASFSAIPDKTVRHEAGITLYLADGKDIYFDLSKPTTESTLILSVFFNGGAGEANLWSPRDDLIGVPITLTVDCIGGVYTFYINDALVYTSVGSYVSEVAQYEVFNNRYQTDSQTYVYSLAMYTVSTDVKTQFNLPLSTTKTTVPPDLGPGETDWSDTCSTFFTIGSAPPNWVQPDDIASYEILPFTVGATGDYSIATLAGSSNDDTIFFVFNGEVDFSGVTFTGDFIVGDDDSQNCLFPDSAPCCSPHIRKEYLSLTAGMAYTLVVASYWYTVEGVVQIEFSGPGVVNQRLVLPTLTTVFTVSGIPRFPYGTYGRYFYGDLVYEEEDTIGGGYWYDEYPIQFSNGYTEIAVSGVFKLTAIITQPWSGANFNVDRPSAAVYVQDITTGYQLRVGSWFDAAGVVYAGVSYRKGLGTDVVGPGTVVSGAVDTSIIITRYANDDVKVYVGGIEFATILSMPFTVYEASYRLFSDGVMPVQMNTFTLAEAALILLAKPSFWKFHRETSEVLVL